MRRFLVAAPCLASAPFAASCGRPPAALDPAGPQASSIAILFWWFLGVCALVYALVLVALALSLVRGARGRRDADREPALPLLPPEPSGERSMALLVGTATVATALVLLAFLLASMATSRALAEARPTGDELVVRVTGHQWWWEVVYPGDAPSEQVVTATEIHVPVGVSVRLELSSTDVIHSFWVPRLQGKRDLIPGRRTHLELLVEREGVYRGQCAEYCGHQHAHMGLLVIAEPRERFAAWLAAQRLPARDPATDEERRGREVFLAQPCVMCHTIRGTAAGARAAPDLTHLASRRTIAAATAPNGPGHLAGWILDSQGIKPGNAMPPVPLPGRDLQALLAYLRSLA